MVDRRLPLSLLYIKFVNQLRGAFGSFRGGIWTPMILLLAHRTLSDICAVAIARADKKGPPS